MPDAGLNKHFRRALLVTSLLPVTAGCKPPAPPANPRSPEGIVLRLKDAHTRPAIATLAEEFVKEHANRVSLHADVASLVSKLDRSRFEDALLLQELQVQGGGTGFESVDAAMRGLKWPAVPSTWTAEATLELFTDTVSNSYLLTELEHTSPSLRALAVALWPTVSKDARWKGPLERARRTPLKAVVDALTSGFDLRIDMVTTGTEEIPASSGGNDVFGQPVTAIGYKEIPSQVRESMRRLMDDAFKELGLNFSVFTKAGAEGAPATLEVRYEVTKGDKLYEAMTTHAWSVRVKASITLRAGGESWTSEEFTVEPDAKVEFDMMRNGIAAGLLDNALENLNVHLLKALVKESK